MPAGNLTPRPPAVPWEVAGALFVVGATAYAAVRSVAAGAAYHEAARLITLKQGHVAPGLGTVLIACAGNPPPVTSTPIPVVAAAVSEPPAEPAPVPADWPTATPEEVGLDSKDLADLLESIQTQGDPVDSVSCGVPTTVTDSVNVTVTGTT